ncbi:peptide/nickel transport system permease protein [Streptosporangium becharense]|uniref:Peptide/nickel transport system permease protein n=1 Tax=Streptosporangium becharense TaxID=1816182 RepID=A0A7W9MK98_9ACTN|nr:ABC transporter permease [Streptosporangium becharense]MBB2914563.1 peptide/nickel transport system permease protein [Streptosporangium becharense]MBB5823408.1 peptide/nickel transport system permease protein [Streptosporangium becharense]
MSSTVPPDAPLIGSGTPPTPLPPDAPPAEAGPPASPEPSPEPDGVRRPRRFPGPVLGAILRERSARVGLVLVGVIVLAALLAPLAAALTGHGPNQQFRSEALSESGLPVGPGGDFLLGADGNGRDVLVRTLYGARISLLVGIPATTLALVVGTAVGLVAGFFAGRTDRLLSQVIDVALSFPFVVTALSLVALNGGGDGQPVLNPVVLVTIVISLFAWTYFARLTRGLVIVLRGKPFVEAALSVGASRRRVITREILPNVLPVVAVYWAVQLPLNILSEATLSFLGVGVQAPTASWGNMIAEAQRSSLYQVQPWFLLGPGIAMFVTVLGFNAISSGIRNVLDPDRG